MSEPPVRHDLRIAVVEDHALVRAAIRDVLVGAGFDVVDEFATGEAALEGLPISRPNVVLVDLDLPGMSGSSLVRELAPRLPRTTFVVLTASQQERDVLEAVRSGAHGYLSKDLDQAGLIRALEGLERHELPFARRMVTVVMERMIFSRPGGDAGGQGGRVAALTDRENEILALLADGLTDRQIAEALVISRRTVESHVTHLLHKLGVQGRVEAARIYKQLS